MTGGRKYRNRRESEKSNESQRLVGWLVSYQLDVEGKAFEIKSGRNFITANGNQAENVISIREKGVSSPHAAMKASPEYKVVVQDIFSECGTYLQRADSDQEEKVQGPVELKHGDWLRIGENIRFQACLIERGPVE